MYQYQVEIQRVIDGDTYVVDIDLGLSVWVRGERIRLYGINTPEIYGVKRNSEEYLLGKAASNFAKALIKKGTLGVIEAIQDEKGKYGRYLAVLYIRVPDDLLEGHDEIRAVGDFYCLNDLLVAKGFAEPYFL